MNSLRLLVFAGLCVLPTLVEAMDLSGSVLGVDRKPIAGVQVRLVGGNALATTDALGDWRIQAPSTRIGSREVRRMDVPRELAVENGRLRLRLSGRDPAGRGAGEHSLPGASLAAGRVQVAMDTLTYSLGGKVLLRDTVSASRTGIVRILDSTFNPDVVYGYLTDSRDGRNYRTVTIGNQVWMAENLDYEVGRSWWYIDNQDYGDRYGRLYTWMTALILPDSCKEKVCGRQILSRHRGICPEGWHLPDMSEWDELATTVGGYSAAGTALKSVVDWRNNGNGTDTYGFHGLPGGYIYSGYVFARLGEQGFWWSVDEVGMHRFLDGENANLNYGQTPKDAGLSIRCIRGGAQVIEPVVAREGMKLIPAGKFMMGSPATEPNRFSWETQHSVNLSAFWMDSTLVTQGQFEAMMGANPSYYLRCGTACPVEQVTWFDAVLYCNARSKRDGLDTVYAYTSRTDTSGNGVSALAGIHADLGKNGYRLPTEAQSEYAARGGTTTAYYWGDSANDDTVSKYAWYSGNSSITTKPVAVKPANPFGLYDMTGNVSQWTNDWFGTYVTIEQTDPEGPSTSSERVIRGGSWANPASTLRSADRGTGRPFNRSRYLGFRSVRPAP